VQSSRAFAHLLDDSRVLRLNSILPPTFENRDSPLILNIERSRRVLNIFIGSNYMIEIGKPAPDFELASHLGGTKFTLSQFKGQKNVMLVFYPLDWTPT